MLLFLMPKAIQDLRKLTVDLRWRIIEKLEWYCAQQHPEVFAKKLTEPEIGDYRFRIGDYRAIFSINDNRVEVLRIGHRKEIYR